MAGFEFQFAGEIEPHRDGSGALEIFVPEQNPDDRPRHAHANGPFGKFRVAEAPEAGGVFAITLDGEVQYVGETSNLARLAGPLGFGSVSPGKLVAKGPATNCRINALLLATALEGHRLELWLARVEDRDRRLMIRGQIKGLLGPPWNLTGISAADSPVRTVPARGASQSAKLQTRRHQARDRDGAPAGFSFVADIEPERNETGAVVPHLPHLRYDNKERLPLVPFGDGPFCRFKFLRLPQLPGIYAVLCKGRVVYVGICENLARRYNSTGYASIQPRNCFSGGQSTNCRVNHFIFNATDAGESCSLWFLADDDPIRRANREQELIREIQPAWNRQHM